MIDQSIAWMLDKGMKVFLFFLGLFSILSCNNPVHFSYLPRAIDTSVLYSSENDCDYIRENGACFIKKKEIFEIDNIDFTLINMLFILDVSLSMEDTLKKIGWGFSDLISTINEFDWQMAFTTANHGDHEYFFYPNTHSAVFPPPQKWEDYKGAHPSFGRFMPLQKGRRILKHKILNDHLEDYEDIFYDTITLDYESTLNIDCGKPPFCQEGHEQPLRVLKSVMEQADSTHARFFKKDSIFIVFIVTDENERSADYAQAVSAQEVHQTFSKVFDPKKMKMIVHGISIQDNSCLLEQRKMGEADYSIELNQLTRLTGGLSINICEQDYSSSFSRISRDVKRYVREIPLESKVFVSRETPILIQAENRQGQRVHLDWNFNQLRDSVYFNEKVEPGTLIQVHYYTPKESL